MCDLMEVEIVEIVDIDKDWSFKDKLIVDGKEYIYVDHDDNQTYPYNIVVYSVLFFRPSDKEYFYADISLYGKNEKVESSSFNLINIEAKKVVTVSYEW